MSEQMLVGDLGPIAKRWAVLVGIDRYDDRNAWATLKYCVADVMALEQVLEGLGFEPVVCLHDRQRNSDLWPTKENVQDALQALEKQVGPNDLVFVHFACHGMLCEVGDGVKKPFLAMMRSRKTSLVSQGWSVEQVEQWMRKSGAKRLFLSLDACHTGVEMGRGVEDDPEFLYYAYDVLPEGLAVLSASTAQQQAMEVAGLGHGVYTYYLLEALSGKAVSGARSFITVGDIERYVRVEMERFQRKNRLAIQEPTKWSVGRGAEDMKVVDWTGGEMPAIAPLATSISDTLTMEKPRGASASSDISFYERQLARKQAELQAVELDLTTYHGTEAEQKLLARAEQILSQIENLKKKL